MTEHSSRFLWLIVPMLGIANTSLAQAVMGTTPEFVVD